MLFPIVFLALLVLILTAEINLCSNFTARMAFNAILVVVGIAI